MGLLRSRRLCAGVCEMNDPEYPGPTPEELQNPVFEAIWQAINRWDISRYNNLQHSLATGSDVMHILNSLRAFGIVK